MICLYQISQEEGRITRKNGKYKLEFEYRDLWGNLRTAFTDSDSLPVSGIYRAPSISQINDYDPLGFEHFNNQAGTNNKLFQKQERVFDLDLGWDFWKFRPSDASIGRFFMPDPLSQKFPHNSLYAFQENKLGQGVELEGAELKGFGRYLGGVLSGIAEDVSLGAFRAGSGSPEYNAGVSAGHKASVVIGGGTTGLGTGIITGSGIVTAGTLGTASPATAVTALGGTALGMYGSAITAKALSSVNSEGEKNQTGSYTNTHESGKTYHGKGGQKRAAESGKQQAAKNNDPHKSTDWTPAKNNREAFKQESRRLENDADKVKGIRGHQSDKNYNKRDSPGTNYRKQDGEN